MHEEELRALIRAAVAQHLSPDGRGRSPNGPIISARSGNAPYLQGSGNAPYLQGAGPAPYLTHLSHGRFVYLAPTDPDAPCVVEPQVQCHHCGFCQSYGH